MNESFVKSLNSAESAKTDRGPGNVFGVQPVTDQTMARCSAAFVTVGPGNAAYGYHYHESVEEVFYVISGQGSVRTPKGELSVKAGDAICFPTGEGGAHVIANASESENLVYLDFGTRSACEIVHLPEIGKLMSISKDTFAMFDAPGSKI